MADTASPRHPVHLALTRVPLVAGAPRSFVVLEGLLVSVLLFGVGLHFLTVAVAGFYVLVCHPVAVLLAARDAQIADVYLRSLAYADYYDATPHLYAPVPLVHPAVPTP
jgi:type IV secretory pathway TrbD component